MRDLPAWLNNPLVTLMLLPPEDADDPARASAWMARSARPPGAYEIMPLSDPRWPQAVSTFVASMEAQREVSMNVMLVDKERGIFVVEYPERISISAPSGADRPKFLRKLGRTETLHLRVLFLRGMAPAGQ